MPISQGYSYILEFDQCRERDDMSVFGPAGSKVYVPNVTFALQAGLTSSG